MSYSRWSYSVWYSFHNVMSGKTKGEQVLSLWFSLDKTFDWTYDDLVEFTARDVQRKYNCEIEDAEEAMTYINMFIEDVNEEFKENIK